LSITISLRVLQLLAAVIALGAAVVTAVADWWPFDAQQITLPANPTLWQLMLSDDITLGFVRLGLVMLALFVIASVPALIVGGRWIKGFGTSGLTADDAAVASNALEKTETHRDHLQRELDAVKQERDQAISLLRAIVRP
jgi:ABC-type multidrug transport system fused ATPase/permease subunit